MPTNQASTTDLKNIEEPIGTLCDECEDAIATICCSLCADDDNNSQWEEKPLCDECSNLLHSMKKRRNHILRKLDCVNNPIGMKIGSTSSKRDVDPQTSEVVAPSIADDHVVEMDELNVVVPKQNDGSLGFEMTLDTQGFFFIHNLSSPNDSLQVGDVVVVVQGRPVRELSSNQLEHLMHRHHELHFQLLRGHDPPLARFRAWAKLIDARRMTDSESTKEIISLQQTPNGHYHLETNDKNIDRLFQDAIFSDDKVPIISFLGNTTAGKSFLIRSLMADDEIRPFCFDEDKMCSTTANANMYTSNQVVRSNRVNVIDFEGENGLTPFMNMIRRTKHLFHSTKDETKQRHVAVEKYFPKIAYLLSDVIVLVGDTSLVNKEYFHRCRDFAIKANAGVSETMCRPSLLIIHNKCSLTANFDVKATTEEFLHAHIYEEYDVLFGEQGPIGLTFGQDNQEHEHHRHGFCIVENMKDGEQGKGSGKIEINDLVISINGESMKDFDSNRVMELLDAAPRPVSVRFRSGHVFNTDAKGFLDYFADVRCVRVPRGDIRQNIRGKWYNGDEILIKQLDTIHTVLETMVMKQNVMRRDISVGERGWFFLLRSIVRQVANEKPVSFGSLLNELLSTGDKDVDRITSAFVRVYETRAIRNAEWFSQCFNFCLELFARMISFNMRRKAHISILTRETVAAQARKSLKLLLTSLQRFLPCVSVYPGAPEYVCGQHRIFHSAHQRGGHRSCQRVPRQGNAVERLLSELHGGSHVVWEGTFEAPDLPLSYFELEHWDESFLKLIYRYLFDDSDKDVNLKMDEILYELLAKYTSSLQLEFKVLSDNTLTHVPCIRCFKGCDTKDKAMTVKERLLQWHTHIELIYLAPHHLGVCSCCKKYFTDIGLLSL